MRKSIRKQNNESAGHGLQSQILKSVQQPARRPPATGGGMEHDPGAGLPAVPDGPRGDPLGRPAGWRFRDPRSTALVIATGPSSAPYGPADWPDWPALCINDAWERHPTADALYAADGRWWTCRGHDPTGPRYLDRIRSGFDGELWTCAVATAETEGLRCVPIDLKEGLGKAPGPIRSGGVTGNSGAQGINLLYRWGARRIVLVGFDMCRRDGKEHRFGNHPKSLGQSSPYDAFVKGMGALALDLRLEGVEVINTCKWSALPYWPKIALEAL